MVNKNLPNNKKYFHVLLQPTWDSTTLSPIGNKFFNTWYFTFPLGIHYQIKGNQTISGSI